MNSEEIEKKIWFIFQTIQLIFYLLFWVFPNHTVDMAKAFTRSRTNTNKKAFVCSVDANKFDPLPNCSYSCKLFIRTPRKLRICICIWFLDFYVCFTLDLNSFKNFLGICICSWQLFINWCRLMLTLVFRV